MYHLVFKFSLLEVSQQVFIYFVAHTLFREKYSLQGMFSNVIGVPCIVTTLNVERLIHLKCHRHGRHRKMVSWAACAKICLIHYKFDVGACDQTFSLSGANLECAIINPHSLLFHLSSKKTIQVISLFCGNIAWQSNIIIPHFKGLN